MYQGGGGRDGVVVTSCRLQAKFHFKLTKIQSIIIMHVYAWCMCVHGACYHTCGGGQGSILGSGFGPSTFWWVLDIELTSAGLSDQRLYSLILQLPNFTLKQDI